MRSMLRLAIISALLVFLVSFTKSDANDGIGPVTITCVGIDLQNIRITQGSMDLYDLDGAQYDNVPSNLSSSVTLYKCMLVP